MAHRKLSGQVPPHQYIFYGLPVQHSKAVSIIWYGQVYCKGGNVSITPETMWEPSGSGGRFVGSLSSLFGLSGLSGLFRFLNQINQTNQMNQLDQTPATRREMSSVFSPSPS
jgi:hypothetical protein